jgi:hypothetical protein
MHLGVLCQEACSVLILTGYYLEQRERVRRVRGGNAWTDRPRGGSSCVPMALRITQLQVGGEAQNCVANEIAMAANIFRERIKR